MVLRRLRVSSDGRPSFFRCSCGSLVVHEEVKTKVQRPPEDGQSLLGQLGRLVFLRFSA